MLEEDALAEVYEWLYPKIRRYAYNNTKNHHLSDDVACDVMLKLVENIPRCSFNRSGDLLAWTYRVARNRLIDEGRKKTPSRDADLTVLVSDAPGPHVLAQRSLDRDSLHCALGCLTGLQRKVIILRFLQDLDNVTVARLIGRSVASVKSLQHRAIEALRRHLGSRSHDGELVNWISTGPLLPAEAGQEIRL